MSNCPYRSPCHRDQRHARQDALQQSVTTHVEQEYAKFDVRDVPGVRFPSDTLLSDHLIAWQDSLLLNPNITSPTVTSNDDYAASDTSTVDQGYGDAPRERTSPASNSSTSTIHSPSPIPSRPPSVPSPDPIPPPPPPQHQAWNGFKLHVPMHRSQPHRLRSILVKVRLHLKASPAGPPILSPLFYIPSAAILLCTESLRHYITCSSYSYCFLLVNSAECARAHKLPAVEGPSARPTNGWRYTNG